jgi:uncharacterized membrane protein
MNELTPALPSNTFNQMVNRWINRRVNWLAKHWLALVNTFFFFYAGLPFLAPVLLTAGYVGAANAIYRMYSFLCHQLPSRAYFIAGEQVCLCHRCLAIYMTLFIGGISFNWIRRSLKPLPARWYLLFMLPMALDGGMGLASEMLQFMPIAILWVVGLTLMGGVALGLYLKKQLSWHIIICLGCGVLALLYLQFVGPHQSNLLLRDATGFIYGIGTVWVAYPLLEESFGEVRHEADFITPN